MRQAKDRANQARIAHPLKVVHMRLFSNTDDIAISPRTISDPLFGGCRWPTDLTAPNGEAMFCCNGRGSLRPYCEPHMVRAFQATRPADVKTHEAALLAQRRAQAAAEGRQGFSYARAAS
jgi:hypothetical protein